jgi:hypothetical protein
MYMTSHEVMRCYVRQFLLGNYSFRATEQEPLINQSFLRELAGK